MKKRRQKLFQRAKKSPSPGEMARMIATARKVEPEFETLLRGAREAGIPCNIMRHLERNKIHANIARLRHFNAKGDIDWHLPDGFVKYLGTLPRKSPFLCPRLHSMPRAEYRRLWLQIKWSVAKGAISASSLLWEFTEDEDHKKQMNLWRIEALLRRLFCEFVGEAEWTAQMLKIQIWKRSPPAKGSRQKRNRKEILGKE